MRNPPLKANGLQAKKEAAEAWKSQRSLNRSLSQPDTAPLLEQHPYFIHLILHKSFFSPKSLSSAMTTRRNCERVYLKAQYIDRESLINTLEILAEKSHQDPKQVHVEESTPFVCFELF